MRLSVKILLFLAAALSLSVFLQFMVFRSVVLHEMEHLEINEAAKDMRRVTAAMMREQTHLHLLDRDWAYWDDTYNFAADLNREYMDSNLLYETFRDNRTNIIHYYDPEGKPIWRAQFDFKTGKPLDEIKIETNHGMVPFQEFAAAYKDHPDLKGIFLSNHGPVILVSKPILHSDNSGPSRGSFWMGRLLDQAFFKMMSEQTNVDFVAAPPRSLAIPAGEIIEDGTMTVVTDQSTIEVYTEMKDEAGEVVLVLKSTAPRTIYAQGRKALYWTTYLLIIIGLVILIILAINIHFFVVRPIKLLADRVEDAGTMGDLRLPETDNRNDEIGTLSRNFRVMMEKLRKTRKRLVDQSYQAGLAEMAMGTLHNIGNSLNPLKVRGEIVASQLSGEKTENIGRAIEELRSGDDPQRKEKLLEYLDRACIMTRERMGKANEYIDFVGRQVMLIDALLEQQKRMSPSVLNLEGLSLAELVEDVAEQYEVTFRKEIRLDIDKGLVELPLVHADRLRFLQVLGNVIQNAIESIRAARDDGGTIEVTAKRSGKNDNRLVLTIADNGGGLNALETGKVFERGFSTKEGEHRGIGMHWCALTMAQMNGEIRIHSNGRDTGAAVEIELREF